MTNFSTEAIHGHGYYDEETGSFIPPIYMGVICEHPDRGTGMPRRTGRGTDLKYAREENPTVMALEKVFSKLENAVDALAFSSGMGAVSSVLFSTLRGGLKLVVPYEVYGVTLKLARDLRLFGVDVREVWPDTDSVVNALLDGADVVFIETMTNPTLKLIDVREVARAARDSGARLIVDNTFATPYLYTPLDDGVYSVVHSATKYIAGHNDVLAGLAAFNSRDASMSAWEWRNRLGCSLSAHSAYLVLRGLKTLELRFRRSSESARAIAEFLEDHPAVSRVNYPGLESSPYKSVADKLFKRRLYGAVVSFEVRGGGEAAVGVLKRVKLVQAVSRVLKRVRVIKPSPSLGGVESLLTYPAMSSTTAIPEEAREKLGITDGLLRLSVGLEDVDDLIEDLSQALKG